MNTEEYQAEFGEVNLPEGFEDKLRGKSLEEQMEFYRITKSIRISSTSYGKLDEESIAERCYKLNEYEKVKGLIARDGILVGVRMEGYWASNAAVLPYKCVCTYYASDNEGSGTNDREDYAYLICV